MKRRRERIVEVEMDEIEKTLERVKASLGERDHELLRNLVDAYGYVTELVKDKDTSIQRLRKILFGSKTETSKNVLPETKSPEEEPQAKPEAPNANEGNGKEAERKRRPGHGRNGAEDYSGAERTKVSHGSLHSGDPCPHAECKGKVYNSEPGVIVRVRGEVPIQAHVWELEKLRCNLCLEVFTAPAPEGVGEKKYDETAAAMIGTLRYGSGLPFNRIEKLEGNAGIPLPAGTQWQIVKEAAREVEPIYEEILDLAAQGEVLHNDDTPMRILELEGGKSSENEEERSSEKPERTGVFTSGVVSRIAEHEVALYFTGLRHAGENLARVLKGRDGALSPPIHMCDGLSRNVPPGFKALLSNCLAHARRYFVDVVENFPDECRHVLEILKSVYRNDNVAKDMSPQERLELHKRESGPLMDGLKAWLEDQISERKVEPNSGLGEAINYMLKRWERLTLFLRVPGAPLDNNICERMLKKAILHRKNSLFYKTENGARVGDVFMSLIHTAELAKADPFHYLVELLRHPTEIRDAPEDWMPWNYKRTLAASTEEAARRARG